jgi:hypothetical protein
LGAVFSRLQQKAVPAGVKLLERGDWGLHICEKFGPDWDEVSLPGEGVEICPGGKKGREGHGAQALVV